MNNYEIYPQRLGLKSFLLVLYLDQRPSALSNVGIPGATDLRHADAPGPERSERGEAAPAMGPAGLRGARCPALRAEPRDRLAGAELGVRRGVAQKMEFPKWPLDGNKDSNLRLALAP